MSEDWQFLNLAGVWDYRTRAIVHGGDKLDAMADPQRSRSLGELRERVHMLAAALDDSWLVATAVFMVEDLFKSYFCDFSWTPGVVDYIAATAGVFVVELTGRGFVVNYVIDGTRGEAYLDELLTYVPAIFEAAGLITTGPQLMSLQVLERLEGRVRDVEAIPTVIAEGQYLAEELVRRCHQERRSYVYLNMQLDDGLPGLSLEVALSQRNAPRTVVVFRNNPPTEGTEATIFPPPEVDLSSQLGW